MGEIEPELRHRFVFVCGLHRSGTTLVARHLSQHPDASGFSGTDARMDEGIYLQSVYPYADAPGRFGFDPRSHLTEHSELATPEAAARLFAQWAPHWDLTRTALVEKSPSNLIRTRFLQYCFPNSWFVLVTRHPVASSLATKKWCRKNPPAGLMTHWAVCHGIFDRDRAHLRNVLEIRYEDYVADPAAHYRSILDFVGLAPWTPDFEIRPDVNQRYFDQWEELTSTPGGRLQQVLTSATLTPAAERRGYRLGAHPATV